MNAPLPRKHMHTRLALPLGLALVALLAMGTASAGPGGEAGSPLKLIFTVGAIGGIAVASIAYFQAKGRGGKAWRTPGAVGVVVGILGLSGLGVMWAMGASDGGAGATPAATADLAAPAGGYAKTLDLTLIVRDFHTGSAVASADIHLYKNSSGYTPQQVYERSVPSVISCTTDSNGQCKISGLLADVYDMCATKAGYYTAFEACSWGVKDITQVPFNPNTGSGALTLTPPLYLRQHGTADLTKTSTTISSSGCTAGTSTCPLVIFYGNDKADSVIAYPAVKLVPKVSGADATTNNLTFASMQSGSPCTAITLNSVTYVYDPNADLLPPKQWRSCGVNMNYATGSDDAKIGLVMDDGFIPRLFASMATKPGIPSGDFVTNANWPSLASVTLDVTR